MANFFALCPNLLSLQLASNSITQDHALALAQALSDSRSRKLRNITLGSNPIGNIGIQAIVKALQQYDVHQLYIHGTEFSDAAAPTIVEALAQWPNLWGLGCNGNPLTNAGAQVLASALYRRTNLLDIGISFTEITDEGLESLAIALQTCPRLRYVFVYSQGFKSANKLRHPDLQMLSTTTVVFDPKFCRYMKPFA
jgi:Ran GTPase-activating protein (RanGAP) involved in mRNA processing and transport